MTDAEIEKLIKTKRDRAVWIAAAKKGIADESRHLAQNGPSLARFRKV